MENIRTIIRGDSYALRRPLYTYTLVDDELNPLNLAGCTVRSTYRAAPAAVTEDPEDGSAVWKGTLVLDSAGVPTLSQGIALKGAPADGIVEVRMSAADTRVLPIDTPLISDLEVTDAQGEKFTFMFNEKLVAVDGVTHRLEG